MSDASVNRQRLAAILAADGVGYSRLMADDAQATLASLDAAREAFRVAILAHGGRVIDMAGDSVLAVFDTAAGAVTAALEAQQGIELRTAGEAADKRLRFRAGLHLGDVIEKADGSVYGDGVNIAARLQALASPGGIVASEALCGSVRNRVPARFENLGAQHVKNIADPVRAFRVMALVESGSISVNQLQVVSGATRLLKLRWFWLAVSMLLIVVVATRNVDAIRTLSWARFSPEAEAPAKSIAVLPFVNMTSDKEQEFFSDGLADELIDQLVKNPELRVIARSSSFAFRGRSEDIPTIARKLNVANILEGSVRRSGNRLRVTTTLVRASTGQNLWSETYDRELRDVFEVQDEIARAVVDALQAQLLPHRSADLQRTSNLDAYVQYLLGREYRAQSNIAGYRLAAAAFGRAVQLDPNYAAAYAGLAIAEYQVADDKNDAAGFKRAEEAARKAVEIGPEQADGYFARGYLRHRREWNWQGARADFQRALAINPGDDSASREYGLLLFTVGAIREAISVEEMAAALDPLSGDPWAYLSRMYYAIGDTTTAHRAAKRAVELQPASSRALISLGTSQLLQGQAFEARRTFQKIDDAGLRLTGVAMAEHTLGRASESTSGLNEAITQSGGDSAYQIAQAYAWRGEPESSFEWLERSFRQRDGGLILIKRDVLLASLHADPRFHLLLVKLDLAE